MLNGNNPTVIKRMNKSSAAAHYTHLHLYLHGIGKQVMKCMY
jgi:hypothetical protein